MDRCEPRWCQSDERLTSPDFGTSFGSVTFLCCFTAKMQGLTKPAESELADNLDCRRVVLKDKLDDKPKHSFPDRIVAMIENELRVLERALLRK